MEPEEKALEHCLEYIRSFNDSVIEANPRSYAKQDGLDEKLWGMGSGRVCRVTKGGPKQYLKKSDECVAGATSSAEQEGDEVEDDVSEAGSGDVGSH